MSELSPNNQLSPTILVIMGITGDLAKRKVLPAYYHLLQQGLLAEQTYLIGTSRRQISATDIVQSIRDGVAATGEAIDEAVMARLQAHFTMLAFDPENDADYEQLTGTMDQLTDQAGQQLQRLFYLSVPPQAYSGIVEKFAAHGLNSQTPVNRLLVEKPFGFDLTSAEKLINTTAEHYSEQQLFRIDHYLAKETSQNLLYFRQHNPMFAAIWNKDFISRITITAAEKIGVEGRGNFYDQVGALRDLIQSHLMQLLAITLMEPPRELTDENLHSAKQHALQAIKPAQATASSAVRGQYAAYRQEINNAESNTETFASVALHSDDSRWQGVHLQVTTGKALAAKSTTISLQLIDGRQIEFLIDPAEGINLPLTVTAAGFSNQLVPATMQFSYPESFSGQRIPGAYERVLVEALQGNHTSFASDLEVLASWRILQPLLDAWQQSSDDLLQYEAGSAGPDVSKLI